MKKVLLIAITVVGLVGCSGTLNISNQLHSYQSQNYTKVDSSILLGDFTYEPAQQGRLKESQLENTAVGTIYLDRSVAEIVKQITAKELQLTGINIGTGNLKLLGNVKQFKMDDLGYSVDFIYTINYKLIKNNSVLWDRDYSPKRVTVSKFESHPQMMITNQIYRMIGAGYDKFINDTGVKQLLETNK
ncbi:integron protein cassette protein [Actinobacillus porcinus]|uniref:integron protein cassette protein n=1 Tax=Actinobacillus porcinus TaxID=51048 RepID=UPI002A91F2A2|nr:integron protein cassette protein [Actinobacillus porcinus]MDY5848666.1 integron protein cassette protein [Actinobacillus porcinus]MDY6216715.1 integron protein cassette protein [Actinobacillus porcinus]